MSDTHSLHREIEATSFPSTHSLHREMEATSFPSQVRLLHLSDTHSLHREIEATFPLPEADIFIHTGDFTNRGTPEEFADFNAWLGELRPRFKHILVIWGNHEYYSGGDPQPDWLSNATCVLNHEEVIVEGIRIYGSPWCVWHKASCPGDEPHKGPHRFGEIPPSPDILLTHGPPFGILDDMEGTGQHWGSSRALKAAIEHTCPKVHLFGHVHEQRGIFVKQSDGQFAGRVDYQQKPGEAWATFPPPPPTYPCQLISCNAMKNHPGVDGKPAHIAGPARLILAQQSAAGTWNFVTV